MEYSKFEFRDFGKGAIVVRAPRKDESEAQLEQIVNDVVVDALQENIALRNEAKDDSKEDDAEEEEPKVDIEAIRGESYKNGYDDAKIYFEPLLKAVKEDEGLVQSLKDKIESIVPVVDMQDQMFKLSVKALETIAKKLHLAIPTDFEKIVLGEMMSILNKYYKTGAITITVNPERVDYCQNLLKLNTLPARIVDNVRIVAEETVGRGTCTLNWNETELEYSQEQIMQDTDAILEHLKVDNNN